MPTIPVLACLVVAAGRVLMVDQAHRAASDDGAGTEDRPLRTIGRGAELAQPGDTVLVHAGLYREWVRPPRGGRPGAPITYAAADGAEVVIRGSDVWRPAWKPVPDHPGVFVGPLDDALRAPGSPYWARLIEYERAGRPCGPGQPCDVPAAPARCKPGAYDCGTVAVATGPGRLPRTLGQLFVDGVPYRETETLDELRAIASTWMVSADGNALYVHFDAAAPAPAGRLTELTVRPRVFAPEVRELRHIHVRGFVMEHGANQFPSWGARTPPQRGLLGTGGGRHWVIEGNVVRFAKTIGIDLGNEHEQDHNQPGHHLVRGNVVSDNGLCGIAGVRHTGTHIIENIVERNNALGFKEGQWEQGGIKLHLFTDGVIEGNLIRNNDAFGIWLDNVWTRSRVTGNVILDNKMAGMFIELGDGPLLVANNVIGNSRDGDGIYMHDASGVTVAHNLLFGNAGFGLFAHIATDRKEESPARALVEASRIRVVNNFIAHNGRGAVSLPFPFARAHDNFSDYNFFVAGGSSTPGPIFSWNTSGKRVPRDDVASAIARAVPALASAFGELPLLPLAAWQKATGHDRHSFAGHLAKPALRSHVPDVELELDDALFTVGARPVPGVERDFFGKSRPGAASVVPGPFQTLRRGSNRITLPLPVRRVRWPREAGPPALTTSRGR